MPTHHTFAVATRVFFDIFRVDIAIFAISLLTPCQRCCRRVLCSARGAAYFDGGAAIIDATPPLRLFQFFAEIR
jgi:hypothetical protein